MLEQKQDDDEIERKKKKKKEKEEGSLKMPKAESQIESFDSHGSLNRNTHALFGILRSS